ncbi:MAG: hypothetical protein CVU88_00530 [Firmicutes bacterium HGW-Firmicutes-13]|nr:MAG: hypothetical protein CVU88_00530 [Firmicutes bacterium HGW-Firmicutes-13]
MSAVGIPRALLYYNYYPAWKKFFEELGEEVVLSDKTNKKILDSGIKVAVDETCLPVKLFYGHVDNLKNKNIDYLFIPRIVSVEKKRYLCPKFLGLPNMVQNLMNDLPPIIDFKIDLSKKNKNFFFDLYKLGKKFNNNPIKIFGAYKKAMKALSDYQKALLRGYTPMEYMEDKNGLQHCSPLEHKSNSNLKIAVLGHSYNLNDSFISMDIYSKLREMGVEILTSEMLPQSAYLKGIKDLRKDIFWTFGKEIMGSAYYLLKNNIIDGVILVVSFGCGPDSLVGELIERRYKRDEKIPLLFLTLDEHTGEAGVLTRLEAFIDMLWFRKKSA